MLIGSDAQQPPGQLLTLTPASGKTAVVAAAIFGFVGVLLRSITTSVLTICMDRLAARHEIRVRDRQYERDRQDARDDCQGESVPALQGAVCDLLEAAYQELDRVLAELH